MRQQWRVVRAQAVYVLQQAFQARVRALLYASPPDRHLCALSVVCAVACVAPDAPAAMAGASDGWLPYSCVDAFASKPFEGNPAAVVQLASRCAWVFAAAPLLPPTGRVLTPP